MPEMFKLYQREKDFKPSDTKRRLQFIQHIQTIIFDDVPKKSMRTIAKEIQLTWWTIRSLVLRVHSMPAVRTEERPFHV